MSIITDIGEMIRAALGLTKHSAIGGEAIDVSSQDKTMSRGPCRAFHVGTGGDVDVTLFDGTRVLLKNLADGDERSYAVKTFHTGTTTAEDIVALY